MLTVSLDKEGATTPRWSLQEILKAAAHAFRLKRDATVMHYVQLWQVRQTNADDAFVMLAYSARACDGVI